MTKKKKTQPDGEDSSSSVVKRLLKFLYVAIYCRLLMKIQSIITGKIITIFFYRWTVCISIFWFVWMCLTILLVGYILISGLVIYSTELKMEFIFFNRGMLETAKIWFCTGCIKIIFDYDYIIVRGPWVGNISACRDFGVVKCENFFLDGPSGKLGSWYVLLCVENLRWSVLVHSRYKKCKNCEQALKEFL